MAPNFTDFSSFIFQLGAKAFFRGLSGGLNFGPLW